MSGQEKGKVYIKKQIMFDKDKDYNYIAYNIIVFLNYFECSNDNKKWIDYRKLIYLYPFAADMDLNALLQRSINPELSEIFGSTSRFQTHFA